MALPLADFLRYDLVVDETGLLVAWEAEQPFVMDAPDLIIERQDFDTEINQNFLDSMFWGGNRSWHDGAGQKRLEMPNASSAFAFLESKGVNITEPGELTLLPETSRIFTFANQSPLAPPVMAATDSFVYVAVGNPNVKQFSALDGSDATNVSWVPSGSEEVYDMTADGGQVYVAGGTDGIHRAGTPSETQIDAFDATTGWSGTDVTPTVSTTDKKEGTGSLTLTHSQNASRTASKTFGAPLNLSGESTIQVWVKPNRDTDAGDAKVRLQTSSGNYFERDLPALSAGVWYQDRSSRDEWTETGTGNWASIASITVTIPAVSAPVFKASNGGVITPGKPFYRHNYPAGTQAGDLLVWVVNFNKAFADFSAPSGWTSLLNQQSGSGHKTRILYRLAESGDTPYVQFSNTGVDSSGTWAMVRYANAHQTTPINAQGTSATGLNVTSITAPSVTTTAAQTKVLAIFTGEDAEKESPTFERPTGTVRRVHARAQSSVTEMFDYTVAAAGASGTKLSNILGATNANARAIQIAIAPQASTSALTLDDMEGVTAGTFSHWSDWDARVVGWAKNRIYAGGVKTGTTWRFFEAASTTTSTEILELPDGWEVTAITELAAYVYFAAKRSGGVGNGVVYAYDGTNTPFVALRLPPGIVPLSLTPFAGAGLLVGCRKSATGANTGQGLLYRAFPASDGWLTAEPIEEFGEDNAKDYGIRFGFELFEETYFGWSHIDDDNAGLGMYLPRTGAYSTHLCAPVGQIAIDGLVFKGRKMFTIDGDGCYVEQDTLMEVGWVLSSIIDTNISAEKLWIAQESHFDLQDGGSIRHDYTIDEGLTYGGGDEATTGQRLRTDIEERSPRIQARAFLLRDATDNTKGPRLFFTGIGGWPASKPRASHQILVRATPELVLRDGTTDVVADRGWRLLNTLKGLRDTHDAVDYQPPWWEYSQQTLRVRVAAVRPVGRWGERGSELGGFILLQLVEVAG